MVWFATLALAAAPLRVVVHVDAAWALVSPCEVPAKIVDGKPTGLVVAACPKAVQPKISAAEIGRAHV